LNKYSLIAILSAVFYSLSVPISKIMLLQDVNPIVLGGFTYLGAGIGLLFLNIKNKFRFKNPLTKKELPYIILMIIFDILAIMFLMFGLSKTNSSNASLLSNFEIVATSLIAFLIFKERISKKILFAILLIIIAGIILTYEDINSLRFLPGSLLVITAYCFWGMENNCTKILSKKNSTQITIVKGLLSGCGSLLISFILKSPVPSLKAIFLISLIGFLSYGISVNLYIYSQNKLGAVKTAGYFSFAPYIAILLSIIFLGEVPDFKFYIALIIMLLAGYIIYNDSIKESRS